MSLVITLSFCRTHDFLGWLNEWINEWTNEGMNEWKKEQINEQINQWMKKGRKKGIMCACMCACMHVRMHACKMCMHACMWFVCTFDTNESTSNIQRLDHAVNHARKGLHIHIDTYGQKYVKIMITIPKVLLIYIQNIPKMTSYCSNMGAVWSRTIEYLPNPSKSYDWFRFSLLPFRAAFLSFWLFSFSLHLTSNHWVKGSCCGDSFRNLNQPLQIQRRWHISSSTWMLVPKLPTKGQQQIYTAVEKEELESSQCRCVVTMQGVECPELVLATERSCWWQLTILLLHVHTILLIALSYLLRNIETPHTSVVNDSDRAHSSKTPGTCRGSVYR